MSSRLQQASSAYYMYPLLLQLKLQHCHGDIPCDKIVVHLNDLCFLIIAFCRKEGKLL